MEWIMNWWWATVLGPIILGGVIAYALMSRRRLTANEQIRRHDKVDRLYDEGSQPSGR